MFIDLLIKGLIIGAAVSIPLGPIGILIVQRTVNKNWKSGFFSGVGAASSDMFYAVIAGFSLTYIINFIRQNQLIFQITGAVVLILLGIHIFRKNPVKELRNYRRRGTNYFQDMGSTFLITFSNPMSIFIFLAVFAGSGVVLSISQPYQALFIIIGIFAGACCWWMALTLLVNLFRHKLNLRILWWFNKIAGIVIVVIVLLTLVYALINNVTI